MTQNEFDRLAMRKGEHVGDELYDAVEYLYMSDGAYHRQNNSAGEAETKQAFCDRVYGADNTVEMIYQKTIAELVRENQYYRRKSAK